MVDFTVKSQFFRFSIVGGVGFFVDGFFLVMLTMLDWNLLMARLGSFACAVSVTWYFNRMWTFNRTGVHKPPIVNQYFYYITVQLFGAGINLGVFFLVIYWFPIISKQPLIALVVGSSVALFFNYFAAKKIVYNKMA